MMILSPLRGYLVMILRRRDSMVMDYVSWHRALQVDSYTEIASYSLVRLGETS